MSMVRRTFLQRSGGALAAMGPLGALTARTAEAAPAPSSTGYGPLVPKGDLRLPADFNYQIISRQGLPQRDGTLTPGIFDGMGAFADTSGNQRANSDRVVLIRNHENRRRAGEIPVVVPPEFRYDQDPTYNGGCTKLVVERERTGPGTFTYRLVDSFNIIGSTDTNCAGGELPFKKWVTCEEVVNRSATGKKHGYVFEVDATADGPVAAIPVPQAGRFEHEAVAFVGGILYLTEDRRIEADPVRGQIGAAFYRYVPDQRIGNSGNLAESTGVLQALKLRDEFAANMDARPVGVPFKVEWVTVDTPDHDDDTNNRRDRAPGFTPTRIQAQDKGAAVFDREEGTWVGGGKVYFDCTEGGPNNLGQIWEYDPGRETVTLMFQSPSAAVLENPDNVTIVPQTHDVFVCEDSPGTQFIRGVTQDGEIYDFAQTITNETEFCGACFDPDGQTLYVNQQGERLAAGEPPEGSPQQRAVTYAIYGPFEKRFGPNNRNFGNGA